MLSRKSSIWVQASGCEGVTGVRCRSGYVMQPLDVRPISEQLFAYRKCQPWPPKVEKGKNWDFLYNAARGALPVCPTVDEAIDWANDFITKIDKAEDRGSDHA